jgi:hypothetical protein
MAVVADPHASQPVLRSGPSAKDARLVAILLHGRGASAEDILGLAHQFSAKDMPYVAPQAAGSTWYPCSFLAPVTTIIVVPRTHRMQLRNVGACQERARRGSTPALLTQARLIAPRDQGRSLYCGALRSQHRTAADVASLQLSIHVNRLS